MALAAEVVEVVDPALAPAPGLGAAGVRTDAAAGAAVRSEDTASPRKMRCPPWRSVSAISSLSLHAFELFAVS